MDPTWFISTALRLPGTDHKLILLTCGQSREQAEYPAQPADVRVTRCTPDLTRGSPEHRGLLSREGSHRFRDRTHRVHGQHSEGTFEKPGFLRPQ